MAAALAAGQAGAADLTALESEWLRAAAPVLRQAQELKLPIDIIVQPAPRPNDVPFGMGFKDGRCKLVLSMRGNPQAESVLKDVADADRALMIEAMTAHEVAHCWRFAQGAWHALPAGFVETTDEQGTPDLLAAARLQRETRREEGFADLAALSWTARQHASDFPRVHAWLSAIRADQPVPNNAHDTRHWVAVGADPLQFKQGGDAWEAARAPWQRGLIE